MAFAYAKDHSVATVVLRYFGGFSPRSSFSWSGGHIPIFVDAVLHDREVPIHGDGSQTRSMAYVDDIVEGTVLAMENNAAEGEVFNIGNDEEMSVLETARLVHQIANTGKELKLKFVPLEDVFGKYKDIVRRRPDFTKAKKILGYSPHTDMSRAIEYVVNERKKNFKDGCLSDII
jgi:UDP-glucose 4-epimerase